MKIVIIEDEKLVAKDLARTINDINPNIEIVALIESVEDGLLFFKNNVEVDLIFSDIQLGDGLSFEIFEKTKNQTPIVFCTAFNQYAIEAFNTIGIDYILKPITKSNVEKALTKFETIKNNFKSTNLPLEKLFDAIKSQVQPTNIPSVIIHQGDKIIPLEGEKIALFFIDNGIVFAYTFDQKKVMINKGAESGVVNAAGDLTAWGNQINGRPWTIGIADPNHKRDLFSQFEISNKSVATSGDYEKYVIIDGKRYSHTIDPVSGMPAQGLKSVTIICRNTELADALTTPVIVMGRDAGLHMINQLDGVEAIIIDENDEIYYSKNIKIK